MPCIGPTLLQLTLRDRRSATAFARHQYHLKTGRFEQLRGCLADFWAVVLQERIVEEDDLATPCCLWVARSLSKPGTKRLPGKRGQGALRRNAEALLHPLAERTACQPVGQWCYYLSQPVQGGDVGKELRP